MSSVTVAAFSVAATALACFAAFAMTTRGSVTLMLRDLLERALQPRNTVLMAAVYHAAKKVVEESGVWNPSEALLNAVDSFLIAAAMLLVGLYSRQRPVITTTAAEKE